jgi:hypothetical protein
MNQRVAIDYERDGREVRGLAAWRVLEHFGGQADEDVLESIKKRLPVALKDFPVLAHETINVGVLYENTDANAQAFGYNRLICLPPEEHTTNVTLWHELGHVAIRVRHENGEDVAKTSEEFCSIYSLARMPSEVIDEGRIPYLGEPGVPSEEWPDICQRALEYRENNRNYIQKCKEWLEI